MQVLLALGFASILAGGILSLISALGAKEYGYVVLAVGAAAVLGSAAICVPRLAQGDRIVKNRSGSWALTGHHHHRGPPTSDVVTQAPQRNEQGPFGGRF